MLTTYVIITDSNLLVNSFFVIFCSIFSKITAFPSKAARVEPLRFYSFGSLRVSIREVASPVIP